MNKPVLKFRQRIWSRLCSNDYFKHTFHKSLTTFVIMYQIHHSYNHLFIEEKFHKCAIQGTYRRSIYQCSFILKIWGMILQWVESVSIAWSRKKISINISFMGIIQIYLALKINRIFLNRTLLTSNRIFYDVERVFHHVLNAWVIQLFTYERCLSRRRF